MTNFLSMANAFLLNASFSRSFYQSMVLVRTHKLWFPHWEGLKTLLVYRTIFLIGRPGVLPGTLGEVFGLVL